MAGREIIPYGVEDAIPLSTIPLREITPIPSQSYFSLAIHHPAIAPLPPCLLLQDKPHQLEAPKIKVPKEVNFLPPRVNEMLTGVKTNKFRDVTYAKYKSITPRVAIDGVRAAPEQVKIVPPKEKEKAPPTAQENKEKHQRMTVMLLNDKIQTLTQVNHALQHRIDKEHTHLLDLEHEVTILCRYVVNKDKLKN
jgi:hypothetical protein